MNKIPANVSELRLMLAAGIIVDVRLDFTKPSNQRTSLTYADGTVIANLPGRLGYSLKSTPCGFNPLSV